MDRAMVNVTQQQITGKRLIIRIIGNDFSRFNYCPYLARVETTLKHALHGMLAEDNFVTVH